MQETEKTQVQSLGRDPLEVGMATHSSVLAWRIPWTEEPGGLHGVAKSWTQLKRLSSTRGGDTVIAGQPSSFLMLLLSSFRKQHPPFSG